MILSTNVYENFTFSLFAFIRELNYVYGRLKSNPPKLYSKSTDFEILKKGLFGNKKKNELFEYIDLSESYPNNMGNIPTIEDLKDLYKNATPFLRWSPEDYSLTGLKEFALFLDTAEKAFMFDNSAISELWSEINGSSIIINFDTMEYKSKVIIDKTKLPDVGSFLSATSDDEYNRLFNTKSIYKTSIEIVRTIGRKSISSFNYLSNDPIRFTDPLDDVIFENFKTDLSLKMNSVFDNIIDEIIIHGTPNAKIYGEEIGDKIYATWKDIMNYGIWFYKQG